MGGAGPEREPRPGSPRRLASIDLGTNTIRLLVVEATGDTWRVLHEDQRVTRLGEGLARTGRLAEAAMARTLAVVARYVAQARDLGASTVRIIATSAVRDAVNGRHFVATVERRAGVGVRVVSGEEEAHLTALGIRRGLKPPDPLLALDIGGGSTELLLARGGRVELAVSLRLGVLALAERYPFPGPVEAGRYAELIAEVRATLARAMPRAMRETGARDLVGTAGTVTTLAALDLGLRRYDPARIHGHRLDRAGLERLRQRIGALTLRERAALPCLEPGRADLLVPGLAVLLGVLEVTGAEGVVVSEWGLREGVLVEALYADPVDTLAGAGGAAFDTPLGGDYSGRA